MPFRQSSLARFHFVGLHVRTYIHTQHHTHIKVSALFSEVDMNNDGLVEYREFETALDSVKTKILSRFGDAVKL
jgi:hypothetical protein